MSAETIKALEDAIKHIEFSADNEDDREWGKLARAESDRLQAIEKAAKKLYYIWWESDINAFNAGHDRLFNELAAALKPE